MAQTLVQLFCTVHRIFHHMHVRMGIFVLEALALETVNPNTICITDLTT